MKSVLHLCRRFFPQRGGSETYTGALIPALASGAVKNRILAAGSPESDYAWSDLPVVRADDKVVQASNGRTRFYDRFVALLDEHRPDIVHWHFLPDEAEQMLNASIERKVRNVHTLHHPVTICPRHDLIRFGREVCDRVPSKAACGACMTHFRGVPASISTVFATASNLIPISVKSHLPPSRVKTALTLAEDIGRWLESQQRCLARFDAHVVLSVASVKALERSGVDARRIRVSRLGTHHPSPAKTEWLNWHVAGRPMRVVFVGRLDQVKGVVALAEAASTFSASELQLDIYGMSGDADEKINELASTTGSPVRYLGHLNDGDVVSRMSEYDFVAIPSQFFETGPFTAVEALQAGTPILASNLPSLNEFMLHGKNGWLVPPRLSTAWRDALRTAIDEPDLAGAMRKDLSFSRSMQDVALEMLELYETVANTEIF